MKPEAEEHVNRVPAALPALNGRGGPDPPRQDCFPGVFVFNPFAEGYMRLGPAFAPVQHQALLAEDLANLPQFLCGPDDLVLLRERPSAEFLNTVTRAGFHLPEFVELKAGGIDFASPVWRRKIGVLRPWAWGPDSVKLLEPLFALVAGDAQSANPSFHDDVARLYSKAWSADFLRKVLARFSGSWLCATEDAGVAVDKLEDALGAIAAIRGRGHHRVVVKEAHGVAGHNAIRLWEPEILPAQRQWLAHALKRGRQVVVEPWLERELDFSVQLEMGPGGLKLCGYTGLVNDLKGQFLANWAEPGHDRCLPARVTASLRTPAGVSTHVEQLCCEISSMLEPELQRAGFAGPVGIDALVYRTPQGDSRLKPVVEINPRYTMGRLTLELMKQVCSGSWGLFRLVTRVQARAQGFAGLAAYGHSLSERLPLCLEGGPASKIRRGALCLNDPGKARVCLATFEVSPDLDFSGLPGGKEQRRFQRA